MSQDFVIRESVISIGVARTDLAIDYDNAEVEPKDFAIRDRNVVRVMNEEPNLR